MDRILLPVLMTATLTVLVSCHQVCFIGSEYNPQSGIPSRWFLPYKDPCECTAVRLGGMHIPASSYHQGAPYYLYQLFLSEDSDEIQAYFNCEPADNNAECSSPQPLGMEDGTIPDDRITASSSWSCCPSGDARLNNINRWAPLRTDDYPWIEADLVESTVVSGVTIQGFGYQWFVKQYMVAYKKQSSSNYEHVKDGTGNIKVFICNVDDDTPVTNLFDESVVATVVRIEPTAWKEGVALRFELLGCRRD